MRPTAAKQQGMTLLEVLVATGILAVISALAFVSINNLAEAKRALHEKVEALNQTNLTFYTLLNDLQLAVSSNQTFNQDAVAEFMANSQSITLLRFANATAPLSRQVPRSNVAKPARQGLIRVKWYVRNNQWFRATQPAAAPLSSNQWQTQMMHDLDFLNCQFQNKAGVMQAVWPNNVTENAYLPDIIRCEIQTEENQNTVLNIVPWQHLGWT